MSGKRRTILEQLAQEVEIPERVRQRADMAYEQIRNGQYAAQRANDGGARYGKAPEGRLIHSRTERGRRRRVGRKIAVCAAAAVLTVGVISAGAAVYRHWTRAFSQGLQVSEEQKKTLETTGMAVSYEDQTMTDQGITVSLEQSIVDNYFAYLVFKVEGYQVESNVQPGFETLDVLLDGERGWSEEDQSLSFTAAGNFYDGLIMGPDGSIQKADGSPRDQDENGNFITDYMMEDGSLEYWVILDSQGNKGCFLNKEIHVEMKNIGTLASAEYFPDREGQWSFDFTLTGSDEMRSLDLEAPIGDTGMTVTHVELSPVSAYIEYQCPEQNGFDAFRGVFPGLEMADGSMYPSLWLEPGIRGPISQDSDTWVYNFSFDRILDVDQVEALLFQKPITDDDTGTWTEEDFYAVPIEP